MRPLVRDWSLRHRRKKHQSNLFFNISLLILHPSLSLSLVNSNLAYQFPIVNNFCLTQVSFVQVSRPDFFFSSFIPIFPTWYIHPLFSLPSGMYFTPYPVNGYHFTHFSFSTSLPISCEYPSTPSRLYIPLYPFLWVLLYPIRLRTLFLPVPLNRFSLF